MSARDDHQWLADQAALRGDTSAKAALDEIDRLRAKLTESERREKAWMNGVADFVEQFGFDRDAACGPADLLPGLKTAEELMSSLEKEIDDLIGSP